MPQLFYLGEARPPNKDFRAGAEKPPRKSFRRFRTRRRFFLIMPVQELQQRGFTNAEFTAFSGKTIEISTPRTLEQYIHHFDTHFFEEGLPADWYDLKKKVGFSMDSQMRLLKGTDKASVELWSQQTKRDALAFCLEYLSQGFVFPFRYEKRQQTDGIWKLVDPKYGKEMLDMVSSQERNGSVKRSLTKIRDFFLSPETPDGAVAIMPSPSGPSGLSTDDGNPITYPDSYWFMMAKVGNEVQGCTIKTDFSLEECRLAIERFTGEKLPENASLEDYVESIALLKGRSNMLARSDICIKDILAVLQNARVKENHFAFQNRTWGEVERDIQRGEELYEFNERTQHIIQNFTEYVTSREFSHLELRKTLAATMLLLSKLLLVDKPKVGERGYTDRNYQTMPYVTFGHVLDELEKIPGCAGGGGSSTVVSSLVSRLGKVEQDKYGSREFECPHCHEKNVRPKDTLISNCQHCGKDVTC